MIIHAWKGLAILFDMTGTNCLESTAFLILWILECTASLDRIAEPGGKLDKQIDEIRSELSEAWKLYEAYV